MPAPHEILRSLTLIANEAVVVAVFWHALVAIVLVTFAVGWRPSARVGGALLAAPLASVSALAWSYGNPFNGGVFALAGILLVVLAARRAPASALALRATWIRVAGGVVLAFGLAYPEFVAVASPVHYLAAAPVGLIPCPTLATVVGLSLVMGSPGRAHDATLGALALFYGLFGALRLGVRLDLGLALGAALILFAALSRRTASARRPTHGRPPAPSAGPGLVA